MLPPVAFLPLVVVTLLVVALLTASLHRRLRMRTTRLARWVFGRYVSENPQRQRMLRAAYIDTTYRSYAARTYLYAIIFAVAGSAYGAYGVGFLVVSLGTIGDVLSQLPSPMGPTFDALLNEPTLTVQQLLAIIMIGGLMGGGAMGAIAYTYRWQQPKNVMEVRRRGIEEGLPRTVAFTYALIRGGMEIPEVLRILADNRDVYGDAADELSIAVREMDMFGNDVVTAIRRMSKRTPSDTFKTFAENFASVLQSGQSLSVFLREQYDRYQEDAEEHQREVLDLLATIAEGYVTVLVAGVLFLITILLVFGVTTTNTLGGLKLMAYLIIPLANLGFVLFLDQQLQTLGIGNKNVVGNLDAELSELKPPSPERATLTDGGRAAGVRRGLRDLRLHDSVARFKRVLRSPLQTLLWHPTRILYVTVPLSLAWIGLRLPAAFAAEGLTVRVLDDIVLQALLVLLASFAIVWELYRRRIREVEAALPELLERLASLNEAGMAVVESIDRVRGTDLGVLTDEIDRIWRDVQFNSNLADAFRRFGLRMQTASITRAVTLLTNAMGASGNLGPVLRIAAKQAQAEQELQRRRRQQMLTYLVVIYISFVVFLVIIVAVDEVLVPSLPTDVPTPNNPGQVGIDVGAFTRFARVDKAAYTLVFFHTALIQAICSGFVAGQLGEGTLKDGTKHAAIMLGVAYVAFLLLSAPVASVTFTDQTAYDDEVFVEDASVSDGGFVVIKAGGVNGTVVGHSDYLAPGAHSRIRIELDGRQRGELYAVTYLDTNDNEEFDYTGNGTVDRPYPAKMTSRGDRAVIERDDRTTTASIRPRLDTL
jgi:flagellar protein FlaJ